MTGVGGGRGGGTDLDDGGVGGGGEQMPGHVGHSLMHRIPYMGSPIASWEFTLAARVMSAMKPMVFTNPNDLLMKRAELFS